MLKIITYNVNGIRSALNKGFIDFLEAESPDIVCVQEIKANAGDFDEGQFKQLGYHCYWYSAGKKGYSGVGILSKIEPVHIVRGIGHDMFDNEGRVIRADYNGFSVMSCYFPSGTTGDIRQAVKYQFLDHFYDHIRDHRLSNKDSKLVICGDYNICHQAIDIHDPISNKHSSGFLPEERAWMDKWFETGMIDSFRLHNPQPHAYTWWSFRSAARSRNKGWRIDYISVTSNMRDAVESSGILDSYVHSDHCGSYITIAT